MSLSCVGRLGGDAVLKKNNITFSMACQNGEHPQWVHVSYPYTPQGKLLTYLVKGKQVFVSGTLKVNHNNNRIYFNLYASGLSLLSDDPDKNERTKSSAPTLTPGTFKDLATEIDEDDIPF